jgi:dethiobiotin synthetase
MSKHKSLAYFITGTDTGVGKTLVASALIHGFAQQGFKSVGLKPVAAGCRLQHNMLISEDVELLMAASNTALPMVQLNPYAFAPAIAPHIAAAQAGVEIKLQVIQQAYQKLVAQTDVVIVEGVGGFRVPLSDGLDTADLAESLALPVILVVGMRLGCLSHALLTAEAIRVRGLKLAGWVANQVDPEMTAFDENLLAIKQRLAAPCLGVLPWMQTADFRDAAKHLHLENLD